VPPAAENSLHSVSLARGRADRSSGNSDSRRHVATSRWLEARWKSPSPEPPIWLLHRGGSMAPALRDGDRVCVQSLVGAAPPRPGEILIFRRDERLVAHRLVAVGDGFVVTRGDASARDDSPIPPDRLLGRVTKVKCLPVPVRWARRLRSYLIHFRRR
jgi:hypothetical protein